MTKKLYAQRIDPKIRDDFIKTCNDYGLHQATIMESILRNFISNHIANNNPITIKEPQNYYEYIRSITPLEKLEEVIDKMSLQQKADYYGQKEGFTKEQIQEILNEEQYAVNVNNVNNVNVNTTPATTYKIKDNNMDIINE